MLEQYRGKAVDSEEITTLSDSVMDTRVLGERCISQRHDQIISNQKAAISELRYAITSLEERTAAFTIPNFALQHISNLKSANEALEEKVAAGILASKEHLSNITDQKLYDEVCRLRELLESCRRELDDEKVSRKQSQDDLHHSEELYLKCIRSINSELSIQNILGSKPLSNNSSRGDVVKQRNKGIEVIMNNIKNLKARVQRQEELLKNYDNDMKILRETENNFSKTSYHVKYLETELEEKKDEISYFQEALRKSRNECASLKRSNSSLRLNKKFSMDYKYK